MKKAIKSVVIVSMVFLFTACFKENHSIRVKNSYSSQINNIVMGSAHIGDVASGATSSYKSINTGNFSISGTTTSGQQLTGSGSISGKGTHKWTATITSSGGINVVEDK